MGYSVRRTSRKIITFVGSMWLLNLDLSGFAGILVLRSDLKVKHMFPLGSGIETSLSEVLTIKKRSVMY